MHWRRQDFVLRGPENRGVVGAEFGVERGMGSSRLVGLGERRKLPQRGPGRPKTGFGVL